MQLYAKYAEVYVLHIFKLHLYARPTFLMKLQGWFRFNSSKPLGPCRVNDNLNLI